MDARRQQFLSLISANAEAPITRKPQPHDAKHAHSDRRSGIDRRRPSWAA